MSDEPLIKILAELTDKQGAELDRMMPEKARGRLEFLIREYPRDAIRIIPQGFDRETEFYENRYFEENVLPERLREATTNGVPISYVVIDVDNIKKINQAYKRQFGYKVIQNLVELLKSNFRWQGRRERIITPPQERRTNQDRRAYTGKYDLIVGVDDYEQSLGRAGHRDKFALLLYGCDEAKAKEVMERFLEKVRISKIKYSKKREVGITISAGITQYVTDLYQKELIRRANKALQQAKDLGGDRVEVYTPALD